MTAQQSRNFIAGEWVEAGSIAPNVNPSNTSDIIGYFPHGEKKDVDSAVAAAKEAFYGWSRTTPQQRHDLLKTIGDNILARKEELGTLLSREEGKTLPEGIGEVVRAGQIFHFFAGEALRLTGDMVPSVRQGIDVEITREGLGVIGLITPWNFPIAIPAWKIAPALAYGNTVVFKPAELVPATAVALAQIIADAGVPAGVFNLVAGRGSVVGEAMLTHPDVDAVSFTGSQAIGRHVAQVCLAGPQMKKIQLEMGGKNPMVVLDDADLEVAVDGIVNGAFFSTGQRCTASSRVIATKGIYNRLVEAVSGKAAGLVVGDALTAGTQMGPAVSQNQLDQNMNYVGIGREEGARLVSGGELLKCGSEGFYMSPAVFADADPSMRIAREEIFGPVAAFIPVKDYDEALAVANDTPFGLSAGICTTSLKYARDFKRNCEAGMVMVNLPTAGVDYHVPFGGRKGSSYGSREQGRYAAEFYTTVKTTYIGG